MGYFSAYSLLFRSACPLSHCCRICNTSSSSASLLACSAFCDILLWPWRASLRPLSVSSACSPSLQTSDVSVEVIFWKFSAEPRRIAPLLTCDCEVEHWFGVGCHLRCIIRCFLKTAVGAVWCELIPLLGNPIGSPSSGTWRVWHWVLWGLTLAFIGASPFSCRLISSSPDTILCMDAAASLLWSAAGRSCRLSS